jgi:hypothetical protein
VTERPKKPGGPIHVASVDLEKRTIVISGGEPEARPSFADISRRLLRPMDETVPVALWRTCPALSWSSCDECPLPIACLSVAQCALAPLEEESP